MCNVENKGFGPWGEGTQTNVHKSEHRYTIIIINKQYKI